MRNFVFVVDGEAAANLSYPQEIIDKGMLDRPIAILSSNPIIIETSEPILEGSVWNGTDFTPPV